MLRDAFCGMPFRLISNIFDFSVPPSNQVVVDKAVDPIPGIHSQIGPGNSYSTLGPEIGFTAESGDVDIFDAVTATPIEQLSCPLPCPLIPLDLESALQQAEGLLP